MRRKQIFGGEGVTSYEATPLYEEKGKLMGLITSPDTCGSCIVIVINYGVSS